MSDPIKPGDKVLQVCACCSGKPYGIGWDGVVLAIENCDTFCTGCNDSRSGMHAMVGHDEDGEHMLPLRWLIKIEPLAPAVTTEKPEEVEA